MFTSTGATWDRVSDGALQQCYSREREKCFLSYSFCEIWPKVHVINKKPYLAQICKAIFWSKFISLFWASSEPHSPVISKNAPRRRRFTHEHQSGQQKNNKQTHFPSFLVYTPVLLTLCSGEWNPANGWNPKSSPERTRERAATTNPRVTSPQGETARKIHTTVGERPFTILDYFPFSKKVIGIIAIGCNVVVVCFTLKWASSARAHSNQSGSV